MDDKPPVLKLLRQVRHQELLLTKIITPRMYDGLILRERVMSEFDRTIKPGCTIVSAPAGSGKTLAVAGWIRSRQIPTAWLTLDSADNDPQRFRTYLLASLDRIIPGIEKRMSLLLTAGRDQQPASFGVFLINELIRHQEPVALVLDDIHVLSDEKLMNDLADIIRYFQDPIRLILVGRRIPGKLMNRLDGVSLLHQVSAETLRFSQLETNTLMERNSIQLTDRQLHIIESRTEGWAMGLVLALRSIGAKSNYHTFIEALNEKGSSLGTYLSEEVFASWPLEVQDFLLKTSILHRMTPALCNAVTGRKDSRTLLKQLSNERAFIICLNQQKGWYRYHNLLVSFLRHRLYRSRKTEVKTLYLKAAAYYERNGITREAIEFHLKGKHYPGASNLIEKMVPDMLRKQQEYFDLRRWLNALPENVLLSSDFLTVTNGWMKLLEGKFRETEEMIRKAKVNSVCTIQDEKQPANQPDSLPEITLLEANLYLVEKRFEEASSKMWKLIQEQQFRTIFPDLCRMVLCRGTATSLLAGPYGFHGRLSLLRSGGQWMYSSMAQQLNDTTGCLKILQAEVHYQRNELDLAVPLLMDGLNDAESNKAWEIYVPAVFLLVKIMTAQGNLAEALQTVEQTEEKIGKINHQAANSF